MRNGCPFLVSSKKAILCFSEKVGSTTWKLALLRAQPEAMRFHRLTRSPHERPPAGTSARQFNRALLSGAVPRFMLVRNPYSRLLSAYLDKVVKQNVSKMWPRRFRDGRARSFDAFVEAVISSPMGDVDRHFQPLSRHCQMSAGDRGVSLVQERPYDFFLKVEQMDGWYLPFVRVLGLEATFRRGWNTSTRWWRGGDVGRSCFFSPPNVSCDAFHARPAGLAGDLQSDHRATPPPMPTGSFHQTLADAQLGQYYTRRLATAVSRYAARDLIEFGYPPWDGAGAAEYIRRIRRQQVNFSLKESSYRIATTRPSW